MSSKANNLIEVQHMMAGWTLLQRVRFVAQECENLFELFDCDSQEPASAAFGSVQDMAYREAIDLCDGNYEPLDDPDACSGGFAENH